MKKKLLLAEIAVLLASVFVFRSVWLLADAQSFMHEPFALFVSLLIALAIIIPALRYIIRSENK